MQKAGFATTRLICTLIKVGILTLLISLSIKSLIVCTNFKRPSPSHNKLDLGIECRLIELKVFNVCGTNIFIIKFIW